MRAPETEREAGTTRTGERMAFGLETKRRSGARSIALLAAVVFTALPSAAQEEAPRAAERIEGFYILDFNRYGELQSPSEREQIVDDLSARDDIERIMIVAYGWANDGEASYGIYRELMRDVLELRDASTPMPRTAVIGIGWDSSQTGFRKLANDLIPFPVLANWLAFAPDATLFPISFWSKAAMADRIGYLGLREELNYIFGKVYPEGEDHPEILLMGHSFGTRIVSGLMQDDLSIARMHLPLEPFASAEHVSGAILLQPALVVPNLHRTADYPVVVTQSRHDHANGFLFPVANSVVNAFSFTTLEALLRESVFGFVSERVEHRTTQAMQFVLPGFGDGDDEEGLRLPTPPLADRPFDLFRRGMAEAAALPVAAVYTAVATPLNYVVTQWRGVMRGPHHHLMDTLAQLPVVEVGVDLASDAFDREPAWGARHKGLFELGLLHESAGRLYTAPYSEPRDAPLLSIDEFLSDDVALQLGCEPLECEGLIFLDASPVIDRGAFNLRLENRLVDYTIGWLDPIGSHANYEEREVVEIMSRLSRPANGE